MIKQIISSQNIWQTCVVVKDDGTIYAYTLKEGESLLETSTPQWKSMPEGDGFIKAKWNGTDWEECATAEEIAQWQEKYEAEWGYLGESHV